MSRHLPVLIPVVLLTAALLGPLIGMLGQRATARLAVGAVAADAAIAVWGLASVISDGPITYRLGGWAPPIGIEFVLDPLSAFFTTVIAVVALIVLIGGGSDREIADRGTLYFTTALLMLTGFQGMIITGDLFNLFVFLEIGSLAGYALIAVGERASPIAAYRYLLVGATGASLYLLGLWFVYNLTGSLNMADVAGIIPTIDTSPALVIGISLMVTGIGVKMALWPLHGWLPDAYTLAPSTSSALIAPIGTKVGAYILIRLLFFVFGTGLVRDRLPITDVILWLSAIGIIAGSLLAIAQREMKRMLAYSSVAQVGYIGLGIGLANPVALIGALLHVVNHAVMKATLFLVAGNMRSRLGHSRIDRIDGAMRRAMPWTLAAFTVAALSMIGVPPTAGFFSKWYLVSGSIDDRMWIMVIVILASSLLNAVYFFRILENAYLRREPVAHGGPEPVGAEWRDGAQARVAAPLLLAVGIILLGVFNVAIVTGILDLVRPPGL